jgi:hypothetical protein
MGIARVNAVNQKGCDLSPSIDISAGPNNRHKTLTETLGDP